MNALIRQIAVLSVLWAVCELILPDGRYQQMVRMTASLLVMAALAGTVGGWLGTETEDQPVMAALIQQTAEETYHRTALTAAANQMKGWCERMARRAGYEASAAVYLTMDGMVDHIQLYLTPNDQALVPPRELKQIMAQQLDVHESRIRLLGEDS